MNEIYTQLSAPFKNEAYSKDSSRGFDLTSIKAQYIKERLNEVFGIFGWELTGTYRREENTLLYSGILKVTHDEITRHIEAEGSSLIKKNLGDSYKGAQTDCLSKACSFIGIGNEVFKGNIDPNSLSSNNGNSRANKAYSGEPADYIIPIGKKYKGKKISECPLDQLQSFCEWIEGEALKKGTPIDGPAKEMITQIELFSGVKK